MENPYDHIPLLRKSVKDFIEVNILPEIDGKTLEIGPRPVRNKLDVDIKKAIQGLGYEYKSVDISPNVGADIVCDVLNIKRHLKGEIFDNIIALEVLEHVSQPWKIPKIFYDILNYGGRLFLSTPFYFLWHDPRPDYWRFSGEGLHYLFSPYFDLTTEALIVDNLDVRTPLHYKLIGEKIK